tara:strand:+ start:5046 stop:6029 length:984 start_codon:yes stop_codon:yes gene_type:complete
VIDDVAIRARLLSNNPRVWFTSFWGFQPEKWGCVSFSDEGRLPLYMEETGPDGLMLIYGAKSSKTDFRNQQGRLLGLYLTGQQIGPALDFAETGIFRRGLEKSGNANSWKYAVKAERAWTFPVESAPLIKDFALQSYRPDLGRSIGRFGRALEPEDARKIANLEAYESPVFGGPEIAPHDSAPLQALLEPSRPGPIPRRGFQVEPGSGTKHFYILKLTGPASQFLGPMFEPDAGQVIVKAGISKHPSKRSADLNRAYPHGPFRWEVLRTTAAHYSEPPLAPDDALATETELKALLRDQGQSLGSEFFLVNEAEAIAQWERLCRLHID